jgi:hypothetical protein|tara:strand:- start:672 stop:794 length:123 start_codon:yes stop_codon:yes gene_type:complete
MAKKTKHFVKLETKKIRRRFKDKRLRHRKKLGPKSHLRIA